MYIYSLICFFIIYRGSLYASICFYYLFVCFCFQYKRFNVCICLYACIYKNINNSIKDKMQRSMQKTLISQYFIKKKYTISQLFNVFHVLLENVCKASLVEIRREEEIMENVLDGMNGQRVEEQVNKMKEREYGVYVRIIDAICGRVKDNLWEIIDQFNSKKSTYQQKSKNLVSAINANNHQIQQNLRNSTTITPNLLNQSNHNKQNPLKLSQPIQLQANKIIVHTLNGTRRNSKPKTNSQINNQINRQSNFSTPIKQKVQTRQKLQNSHIYQSLDKKIQEQALQLLYKQKLKSSPMKRNISNNKYRSDKKNQERGMDVDKGRNRLVFEDNPVVTEGNFQRSVLSREIRNQRNQRSKMSQRQDQELSAKKKLYYGDSNINKMNYQGHRKQYIKRGI